MKLTGATIPDSIVQRIAALSEGSLGHELWPELDVCPEETRSSENTVTAPSCRGRPTSPNGCVREALTRC